MLPLPLETRLPADVRPVVVSVTAPPAVPADPLRVSMASVSAMLGAVSVKAAPPVVTPVGFTVPIVKAS